MSSPDQFRLLTVHAHPDDESSKGAGTVARYHDEGARCVLVCCTGGEAGSILNPAMDTPEVNADIAGVRRRELATAAEIIGYDEVIWLGYRDSGMPDTPENEDPRCFARADLDEAIERLVRIVRRERPHVIVTYPDRQEGYPHPDHLRVHDISIVAFDAAGDPDRFPDAGEPWQPLKLYYTMWSRQARPRDAREDARARSRIAVRRAVAQPAVTGRSNHDERRRRRVLRAPEGRAARARDADRPEVAVLVLASRRSRGRRATRSTTTRWPGASSTARMPEDDLFAGVRTDVEGRVAHDPGARQ